MNPPLDISPEAIVDAMGGGRPKRPKPKGAAANGHDKGHANDGVVVPAIWIDADEWDEASIPRRPWIAAGYALGYRSNRVR